MSALISSACWPARTPYAIQILAMRSTRQSPIRLHLVCVPQHGGEKWPEGGGEGSPVLLPSLLCLQHGVHEVQHLQAVLGSRDPHQTGCHDSNDLVRVV